MNFSLFRITEDDDGVGFGMAATTAAPVIKRVSPALKCVLLMCLFILTFVCEFLPFLLRRAATESLPESRRRKFALAFGFLSCFGGGVFLATCLLDLLPHAHDQLAKGMGELNLLSGSRYRHFPIGEFLIAIGFFLVLFLEQLVLWWKEKSYKNSGSADEVPAASESTEGLADSDSSQLASHEHSSRLPAILGSISTEPLLDRVVWEERPEDDVSATDIHFHPEAHSVFRAVILVFALSLHAVFEGLALGLQSDLSSSLQIFGALAIHKSVLAFSLGLRLVQSRLSSASIALLCVIFSVMAPIGGFVGVAVVQLAQKNYADMASGSLQGIACGTFLYVTAFEILPHELNEPGNRLWKLVMLVLGFTVICAFLLLYPAD